VDTFSIRTPFSGSLAGRIWVFLAHEAHLVGELREGSDQVLVGVVVHGFVGSLRTRVRCRHQLLGSATARMAMEALLACVLEGFAR
jgi:hypothetical protein